ncbi:MAG: histidine phosphatase family protein [Aquificaceae bacterium]|nr:histidine phosphatase family protein [Aquificaceae bacterium]MCX8060337.1 histidine phosphatase family protein [Aquificaceae bacterium]MDW8097442.1 histidine phosphatase family protein [Aquificaceae bacterium]
MVKLYIVRHAESQWNPVGRYQGLLDPELSPRGLEQAKKLAEHFKEVELQVVYSSPLKRTMQTALELARPRGLQVVEEGRVIEIDHGLWSGLLVEEVQSRFPEQFRQWMEEPHRVKFEGGESLARVYERVEDFLREVKEKHWGQTVAVVSHTVPIRAMYCALLKVDLSKFWSFGCDNASYSLVHMEKDRNVIIRLNITSHLGDLYVEAHKAL